MMNSIIYKLVIVTLVAECWSQPLFPELGCFPQIDDTTDNERCTHTLHCSNFQFWFQVTRHDDCINRVYSEYDDGYYDPISVILQYQESDYIVPNIQNDYDRLREVLYSLDLSVNKYASVPLLAPMPNLAKLIISECLLTNAKLSNRNDLPGLIDIDYSQNNINNIEIIPGEREYKNLKKLNISHNYLVTIPDATFDSFPNIESLDLSHNFLYALDVMSFEGIRKLLHLNLSNNRLVDIESSLLRFCNLISLDLGYNSIQTIKFSDFGKLVNLQEIKLESNEISTIEKNSFENMAALTTVDLRNNVLEDIDRDIFINTTRLTTVYLSRNKLKVLPIGMFHGKLIFNFTIEGNVLEGSIERGTFEGLAMVTEMDLSFQRLSSLENYAFSGLQNVKTLLLNNNELESLSNYSFKGLQMLNCLDLSYNRISKLEIVTTDLIGLQILTLHHNNIAHILSNNFIALDSLQLLDLSHNNISYLEPNSFRSLRSLLNFKISENPLTGSIKEKTFDGLGSLPSLDISGTLINSVNNGSFTGMTALRDLNLSHSNITEIQYNSLSYTGNIKSIDLSFNQLTVFDVNTTDLRYLKNLMLNNNMLQVISQTLFNGLKLLTSVILSHNQINTIHREAFYPIEDMRSLDLSYNPELEFDAALVDKAQNLGKLYISGTKSEAAFDKVNNVPVTILEMASSGIQNISRLNLYKLQRLETLVLNNNVASRLEVGALSNLTVLRHLDLSNNNLYYIQPGVFKDTTYLVLLNVSHNNLLEINYGIFQGLMYVEIIDLSYNKIKNLHRSRFYDIEHLNSLIVDNNDIQYISDEEFSGTSLSKLSIGGNPLPCEILVALAKKSYGITITSINKDMTKENVNGVTCNKDGYDLNSKSSPIAAYQDKLLLDIKNILYNISKEQSIKEKGLITNNDPIILANMTEQQLNLAQKLSSTNNLTSVLVSVHNYTNSLLQKMYQNSVNLTSAFGFLVNVNNNTNLLFDRLLRVLKSNESTYTTTMKTVNTVNEKIQPDNLIPLITKIKQNLEEKIAMEKQNVIADLDTKIQKLNSRIDSSMVAAKTPIHEKLLGTETIEERSKSSMFTEVCVGLILVIMVGFLLFKLYKSRFYIPSARSLTISTRNIAESMESAHL